MIDNIELKWQTRDEMETPINPLQKLHEMLTFTSKDCGEDEMMACMYGIVIGWDDNSYAELKLKHKWNDEDIWLQKMWHKNYQKAWKLFMNAEENTP